MQGSAIGWNHNQLTSKGCMWDAAVAVIRCESVCKTNIGRHGQASREVRLAVWTTVAGSSRQQIERKI